MKYELFTEQIVNIHYICLNDRNSSFISYFIDDHNCKKK